MTSQDWKRVKKNQTVACLCTSETRYSNGQTCIVTGPEIDIEIKLIKQTKSLFENKLGLMFQNKETVL